MADIEFILPNRIGTYLQRLSIDYRLHGDTRLAEIISVARVYVDLETSYDGWDGGTWGHEVTLFLGLDDFKHVPLTEQQEIGERIREDLNKASASVQNEQIDAVHIELLDEADPKAQAALSPTAISPASSSSLPYWEDETIRLFISHKDTHKHLAHSLASELKRYGISSFVAHDTIEPDEEWLREIERALATMEVMLALITDNFFDGVWTNQEVGFAKGRQVPVISVKFESQAPAGFIQGRQAFPGDFNDIRETANRIFEGIIKRIGAGSRINGVLIKAFENSHSYKQAEENFALLQHIQRASESEVGRLVEAFNQNSQIHDCFYLLAANRVPDLIKRISGREFELINRKLVDAEIDKIPNGIPGFDDDIPF